MEKSVEIVEKFRFSTAKTRLFKNRGKKMVHIFLHKGKKEGGADGVTSPLSSK